MGARSTAGSRPTSSYHKDHPPSGAVTYAWRVELDGGTPMLLISGPRGRRLAACVPALVTAIATLTTGSAQAVSATQLASFGGVAKLISVSCRGAAWCMAVGGSTTTDRVSHSVAMIWNGTSWRKLKNPPGTQLDSVSCSSPRFCMGSGGPTGAERWNGSNWRTMPSPKGGVSGVSCASRTLCMVNDGQFVRAWNGSVWRVQHQTSFCSGGPPGPCGLSQVSCGSASDCVAVGTQTVSQEPVQVSVGLFWNGKTWARNDPPSDGNPSAANAVSCVGGFCMETGGAFSEVAGGGIAQAATWNASTTTWTDVSPNLGTLCTGPLAYCFWAGVVACAGKTSCMTLGSVGSQFWNGSAWTSAKAVSAGKGSGLQAVSCGGSDCVAVGWRTVSGKLRTLAELWNGSAWAIVKTPL